jgi:hypothetical protein
MSGDWKREGGAGRADNFEFLHSHVLSQTYYPWKNTRFSHLGSIILCYRSHNPTATAVLRRPILSPVLRCNLCSS